VTIRELCRIPGAAGRAAFRVCAHSSIVRGMMPRRALASIATLALAAGTSACGPAPRTHDTLLVPIAEPILGIDPFHLPSMDMVNNVVYDSLIWYDYATKKTYPMLAKSWRRIDDRTLEFDLRDDVTFHDGSQFDADDVVVTLSWLIDPDSVFPTKALYRWIERVEKLGPYRVRIYGNEPRAGDLQNLSFPTRIFSAELFEPLADKADYGRHTPVGTGPYRVVAIDRNDGIMLERNRDYRLGAPFKVPTIDRIHVKYVPDRFAQIAMLMTGELDLAKDLAPDQTALLLERAPYLRTTLSPGVIFAHIRFDAVDRSGNAALEDRRVREAVIRAINRPSLADYIVPGGEMQDSMCLPVQLACAYTAKAPPYDPAAARALLTAAGYPDGFDLEIMTLADGNAIATAVASDLAAVGIRVSVQVVPEVTLQDRIQRGEVEANIRTGGFGNGAGAHVFWNNNFGRPQNDYWHDDVLTDAYRRGTVTVDDAARAAIYARGFDHITEESYMAPLVTVPTVFVHSAAIEIQPNPLALDGAYLYDIAWAH
jgi:peptide/nickel transport system substrate-binding protein